MAAGVGRFCDASKGARMSSDDTLRVLEHHGAAAEANDLDAIMADDADDAFTWKTDAVPFGSDTFVVRGGKITVQTVAMPAE